jgi:DNA-binding transcriptional LysR family regulator
MEDHIRHHVVNPDSEPDAERAKGAAELIDLVRTGRLDVAFVSRPRRDPGEVLVRPLDREPLVLACALDHRFAGCDQVKLQDLTDERFVDFPPDWSTRDLSDQVMADAGVERRVALEASDVHSLLDLVAYGLGVALVPQSFTLKTDRARFIPLAGDVPPWETAAVAADPTSAAAAALLHEVQRFQPV